MIPLRMLLITIFIVGIECAPFNKENVDEIRKKCKLETGMDGAILDKISLKQKLPEPTETYLKYIECSYKNQGFLNGEDHIVFESIKEMLETFYPSTDLDAILERCKAEQQGLNIPAERAYKAARCIINGLHIYEESISNNI
nr:uncharacterized protein LOC111422320 [Onthophagus taurus]